MAIVKRLNILAEAVTESPRHTRVTGGGEHGGGLRVLPPEGR